MRITPLFRDRSEAGRVLAARVIGSISDQDPLVLALPRGGVPVGFEVARALRAELDIFLVRKLGAPGHEELAIGALASGGIRILNEALIKDLRLSQKIIEQITTREQRELERREALYRAGRAAIPVRGRTIVLTDDGLATGASMKAASKAVRAKGPHRLIVAVPVAARQTCDELRDDVDEVICAETPEPFMAVGSWYEDFRQTTDEEVRLLLEKAARKAS
jgi:putative phosphoribosyl transferase